MHSPNCLGCTRRRWRLRKSKQRSLYRRGPIELYYLMEWIMLSKEPAHCTRECTPRVISQKPIKLMRVFKKNAFPVTYPDFIYSLRRFLLLDPINALFLLEIRLLREMNRTLGFLNFGKWLLKKKRASSFRISHMITSNLKILKHFNSLTLDLVSLSYWFSVNFYCNSCDWLTWFLLLRNVVKSSDFL